MAITPSLAAPLSVISTTHGAASDKGAVEVTTSPFQWASKDNSDSGAMCASRSPRSAQSLICSDLIWSYLILSSHHPNLISSYLISSHLIFPFHPIPLHLIPIPSHLIQSHPISSHLISSYNSSTSNNMINQRGTAWLTTEKSSL